MKIADNMISMFEKAHQNKEILKEWYRLFELMYEVVKSAEPKAISEAKDCRVYMEGERYLACFERTAPKNCYLASISQSGIGRAITPPDELIKMSSKIAEKLTTGYICIDWLAAKEKFWFSEIESGGGFWGLPEKERRLVAKSFFLSKRGDTCYELR